MASTRDLVIINQKRLNTREPLHEIIPCVIVKRDGVLNPPNRPNFSFVQELNRPESQRLVWNPTTLKEEGTPVQVEIDPVRQEGGRVIGVYLGSLSPDEGELVTRGNAGTHGANHQMPSEIPGEIGPDPTLVFQPAIQPLKTTGDGSTLIVAVQPYIYNIEGTRKVFAGIYIDLTSYVPTTTGRAVRVLIYLDVTTNLAEVLPGTEVINSGAVPIPYPLVPRGGVASAYVKLVYGQTAVTTATDIDDARSLYGAYANYSFPFSPTEDGQIIIAQNGAFSLGVPMTDLYGDIMTNADGTILTG